MGYLVEFTIIKGRKETFIDECNKLSKLGWITCDTMKVIQEGQGFWFIQQWQKTKPLPK